MTLPQTGFCSVCNGPFWILGIADRKLVSTFCGHVFHEVCMNRWVQVQRKTTCPKCSESLYIGGKEKPFHEIFFDKEDNPDSDYYFDLVKENERVRGELVEAKKNAEEFAEVLHSQVNLLEKQIGTLNWNDFASNFQMEILNKLRDSGCVGVLLEMECALSSITPDHQPNILFKLLTSGDKIEPDVCKMVDELYFQKLTKLKKTVTLEDVIQPLRSDLLSKLRRTSRVETLEANQIPLTAKTLLKLVQGKDSSLLGDIIAIYVDEIVNGSVCLLMNDLCCVTLLELDSELVYGKLQVLNADAIERLQKLVQLGLLKRSETDSFKLACNTVRYYFIGFIILCLMSEKVRSNLDASQLLVKKWSLAYFFLNYWICKISENLDIQTFLSQQKFYDMNARHLLLIFLVVKLKLIEGGQDWLRFFFDDLSEPEFKDLISFIAWKTMGMKEAEIQERKEIISKYLITSKHAPDLNVRFSKHARWEIHIDLIKFLVRNGLDPFQKNEDGDTLLHLATNEMNEEQFHELVSWLMDFGVSKLFLEVSGVSKMTALHYAICRMDVKRETVELFLKAGVSLNKPDLTGRTVMYYAIKSGRGANFLSMLVELGADFETIDEEGNSGVHIAAQYANLEALRYFGEQSVELDRKNNAGETALLRTLRDRSKNITEVVKVLVELGADVNARDKKGLTALCFAMNASMTGVLEHEVEMLMVRRGAVGWLPKPVVQASSI